MSKVIYIEKKSVAPIEPATGAVSDTLNVADKVKNAPSINLVQQMTGIPQDGVIAFEGDEIPEGYEEVENPYIKKLYSGSSYVSSATLSESISNFYGVLIVSHFSAYNLTTSVFLPTSEALVTNIPVESVTSNNQTRVGNNVIFNADGITIRTIEQFAENSYIKAVYGVFRK